MIVLGFISSLSGLVPVIVGLIIWRSITVEMRILLVYFVLTCLVDSFLIHQAYYAKTNVWLIRYFTPLEYGIFALVFSYWQNKSRDRKLLRASIPGFIIYFGCVEAFFDIPGNFDSYTASLEGLFLIGISAYTMVNLNTKGIYQPLRDPRFWICSAVLIYFSGNLILFSWSKVIMVWWIHNVLNIISNLIFAGGVLCLRRQ